MATEAQRDFEFFKAESLDSESAHQRAIKLATSYYLDPVSGSPTGGTAPTLSVVVPGRGLALQIAQRLAQPSESAGSHLRVLAQRLLHAITVTSPAYTTSMPFHPDSAMVGPEFPLSQDDEAAAAILMLTNAIIMRAAWAFDVECAAPAATELAKSSNKVHADVHAVFSAVVAGDVSSIIAIGADRVNAAIQYKQSTTAFDAALGKARAVHLALLLPASHVSTGAPVTHSIDDIKKALHVADDGSVATVLSQADGHSCSVKSVPSSPTPHAARICDQVSGTVTVVTATPPVVTMEHWRELRTRLHTMKARLGDYSKDVADALLSQ